MEPVPSGWISISPRRSLSLSLTTLAGIDARKREPVVVKVDSSQFSQWIDTVDAAAVEAWVYDSIAGWSIIPFQVDEMSNEPVSVLGFITEESPSRECESEPSGSLPPNTIGPCEVIYELTGEGPPAGVLSKNDEMVFLAGYAGSCISPTNWVPGQQGEFADYRYRILVADQENAEMGCVYLYRRTGGTSSTISDLIDYHPTGDGVPANCRPVGTDACGAIISGALDIDGDAVIDSPAYQLDFYGNWTIDKWMIGETCQGQPCPSQDMIDLFKYRIESPGETERNWDLQDPDGGQCTNFRGYIDGPVRVVRDVQGSASGGTTRKIEFAYPGEFARRVYLRVHPVQGPIYTYPDLLEQNVNTSLSAKIV